MGEALRSLSSRVHKRTGVALVRQRPVRDGRPPRSRSWLCRRSAIGRHSPPMNQAVSWLGQAVRKFYNFAAEVVLDRIEMRHDRDVVVPC